MQYVESCEQRLNLSRLAQLSDQSELHIHLLLLSFLLLLLLIPCRVPKHLGWLPSTSIQPPLVHFLLLLLLQQVESCKKRMNTFGFVGDLKNDPEVSCVYHSEEAENQYLLNPEKALQLGEGPSGAPSSGSK